MNKDRLGSARGGEADRELRRRMPRARVAGRWLLALLVALTIVANAAAADDNTYPDKPIHLIDPYGAGGANDLFGRIIGARLEALGQPVIIENRSGAGGNIGTEYVAKARPDGYTLLLGSNGNNTINPALYPSLPFDAATAFAPITKLATVPIVLVASPSLPAKNLAEVIALAKSRPGTLAYASPGVGSTAHLTASLLASLAGIDMLHVPYKGGGAAMSGVLTGDTPLAFVVISTAQALAQAGRVRVIAVTSGTRNAAMPDVPTIAESGFPGFDIASWYGLLAPAGTPPAIVARLHAEVIRILQQPDVRQQFAAMGAAPVGNTPEAFEAEIRADLTRWAAVVKAAGIRAE
ncbi:MAG: tripartite tricarboxylate transporter substrate binding protein [Betaproteobacteria bacterium]